MILALILLAVAIVLNIRDSRSLLLTLLVFFTYVFPFEIFYTRVLWISAVIFADSSILIIAILLNTVAKPAMVFVCTMLIISHINAITFSGTHTSVVYTVVEPFLEYAELFVCSLFSLPIINKLKEVLCPVLKSLHGVVQQEVH